LCIYGDTRTIFGENMETEAHEIWGFYFFFVFNPWRKLDQKLKWSKIVYNPTADKDRRRLIKAKIY